MLKSAIFIGFVVFSSVVISRRAPSCPSCVDESFMKFIHNSEFDQSKNYNVGAALWNRKCKNHNYIDITCSTSCVRIRFVEIGINETTKGWLFGCSASIVRRVHPTAIHIPSEYKRISGDWSFTYSLGDDKTLHYEIEVQFYTSGKSVEKVVDYNRRVHKEKQQQKEAEFCYANLVDCIQLRYLNSKPFHYGVFVSSFIIMIALLFVCLFITVKKCWLNKKNKESTSTRVLYTKRADSDDAIAFQETSINSGETV